MINVALLVAVSLTLGALRVLGVQDEIFQASAHLWVGGLIGAWVVGRRKLDLALAVGLTVLETICFLVMKLGG